MSKKCSTPMPCFLEHQCVHKKVPLAATTGHFWPPNTGEHCPMYQPYDHDLPEKLARMAGAHE